MKALGLDYRTFGLKELPGPFGSSDFLRPEAINDNRQKGAVLRLIHQTAAASFEAGGRIFTPHTRGLHRSDTINNDVTHRHILREQTKGLKGAFEACLGSTVEPPETFLWAATFLSSFRDSSNVRVSDLLNFQQIQAEVASEEGIPIYYGTIGSKREALTAAMAASRRNVPEVTIGFILDDKGKLLHDHSSPADVIAAISERLLATFGFDHCSLQAAQSAFGDLQDHKLHALFKVFFPYPDSTKNAWEVGDSNLTHVNNPMDAASRVIKQAQEFGAQWTGWPCGASSSDLKTFTGILRGSQKRRISIPEGESINNNLGVRSELPLDITDTIPVSSPPESN